MFINDELGQLERGLDGSARGLWPRRAAGGHQLPFARGPGGQALHAARVAGRSGARAPAGGAGAGRGRACKHRRAQAARPARRRSQRNPRARSALLRVAEQSAVSMHAGLRWCIAVPLLWVAALGSAAGAIYCKHRAREAVRRARGAQQRAATTSRSSGGSCSSSRAPGRPTPSSSASRARSCTWRCRPRRRSRSSRHERPGAARAGDAPRPFPLARVPAARGSCAACALGARVPRGEPAAGRSRLPGQARATRASRACCRSPRTAAPSPTATASRWRSARRSIRCGSIRASWRSPPTRSRAWRAALDARPPGAGAPRHEQPRPRVPLPRARPPARRGRADQGARHPRASTPRASTAATTRRAK